MFKKFLLIALMMAAVFAMSGMVMAQDDDATEVFGLTGTANGESSVALVAGTDYEFAFDVFNTSGGDVAIKKVDITLPNTNYVMGTYAAPDAIHSDMEWTVEFDETTGTISWESSGTGAMSSAEIGDIAEGDMLTFSFMATTDDAATDGFAWLLTGDDAGATFVSGVWYFGGTDDDVTPPDDDTVGDDDDDDNDSGGCGC